MERIRVLLADGYPLIRAGIRATLAGEADLLLVGEAKNGCEVQRFCQDLQPDVLLLDLSMLGQNMGEEVLFLKELCSQMKIVILTTDKDEIHIQELISRGVSGYILKDEATEAIVRAIHAVVAGDTWYSQQLLKQILTGQNPGLRLHPLDHNDLNSPLNQRETEIMKYLAEGLSNQQIATEACISERTARHYIEQIMEKLDASNRTKAVVIAFRNGWVNL